MGHETTDSSMDSDPPLSHRQAYMYGRPSGSKGFQNLIKTSKTGKDFKERKKDLKQEERDLKSRKRFQKQRKTSNIDKDFKNW